MKKREREAERKREESKARAKGSLSGSLLSEFTYCIATDSLELTLAKAAVKEHTITHEQIIFSFSILRDEQP